MANPLAGIGGSVNAPGKKRGPRFPGELDQHFGTAPSLAGVSGHVAAPGPRLAPSLGGISGHALAPGPKPPPPVSLKGLSGAVSAPESRAQTAMSDINRLTRRFSAEGAKEERSLAAFLHGGPRGQERQERLERMPPIRPKVQAAGAGGGIMGFISGIGNTLASKELAGAHTVFGTSGVPGAVGNVVGKIGAEALNLPTQALPSAVHTWEAGIGAIKGHPGELNKMGAEFAKNSAIGASMKAVGDVFKGNTGDAWKTVKEIPSIAAEHPAQTALEVVGGAHAIDRGMMKVRNLGGDQGRAMDNGGLATPSRPPAELMPGAHEGAALARPKYSKGFIQQMVQRKLDQKPIGESARQSALGKHFDKMESQLLRITRQGRAAVNRFQAKIGKGREGLSGGERAAIVPFGKFLPDPSIKDANGTPAWRRVASEAVEHYSNIAEHPPEGMTTGQLERVVANANHFQALLDNRDLYDHPEKAFEQGTVHVAEAKDQLKPELEKGGVFSKDEMHIATMKPAFRFYFRSEDPYILPQVKEGESPFKLGGIDGRTVPVSEVDRKLTALGYTPRQRFFTTDNPFHSEEAAFSSGHAGGPRGGEKVSGGPLTGDRFMRGQTDFTSEAAHRQHLFEQLLVNTAHGDIAKVGSYYYQKEHLAKLIENKLDQIDPRLRGAYEKEIAALRHEQGAMFFERRGGKSPTERAKTTAGMIHELYPEMRLEPARVVRPYAVKRYRGAMANRLRDLNGPLDPNSVAEPDQEQYNSLFHQHVEGDSSDLGHVGLVDSVIANRMRNYEHQARNPSVLRQLANFWRRSNIAYSIRHIPGVGLQEMPIRMGAAGIGPLSIIRSPRLLAELRDQAAKSNDPNTKFAMKRLEAYARGTNVAYTEDLTRHVTNNQLYAAHPRLKAPMEALKTAAARPLTGAPLRAVRGFFKTYSGITNKILNFQRNTLEHPPIVAGFGKHYNDEFKALTGKSLKVIGKFSDLEKEYLAGRQNTATVDQAVRDFTDFWGEWGRASPVAKNAMVISPFYQWYVNSLKFIYWTMPAHHPMKTAVLVALEASTEELRKHEGQGYHNLFELEPGEKEASQQGSIQLAPGWVAGQEYYTPPGAVSGGLEGLSNSLLPWAEGITSAIKGYNPLTHKPIEEKNLETGKKEPVVNQNALALAAVLSGLESFVPPARYTKTILTPRPPAKEDVLGKQLGIPPNVWQAIRPIRSEKEYKIKGGKPTLEAGGLENKGLESGGLKAGGLK